jgi:protein AaeX
MRFTEIDRFGVDVALISVMLVVARVVTIALRRVGTRLGVLRHVWHPALFVCRLLPEARRRGWRSGGLRGASVTGHKIGEGSCGTRGTFPRALVSKARFDCRKAPVKNIHH